MAQLMLSSQRVRKAAVGILFLLVSCSLGAAEPAKDRALPSRAAAPAAPGSKDPAALRRIPMILSETLVDTTGFPQESTLEKVLALLEKKLPAGKKISLHIDEKAFGKDYRRVADTPIKDFPSFKATLRTTLHKVLSRVHPEEVGPIAYGIVPTGIVITRPERTACRLDYEVGDLVHRLPSLLPQLKRASSWVFPKVDSTDGVEILAQLLNGVSLRAWESQEIVNGARLVVTAAPGKQQDVTSLLDALRRMLDVRVVMNARLYEVDRAFYKRNVAPLFAHGENEEGPAVVAIDGPLFKKIAGRKLVQKSEEVRLRPDVKAVCLSRQKVFRFEGRRGRETGLSGVSFLVEPQVSPDRRFLGLRISQQTAELVAIDRTRVLDPATGKEVEVASPNVRKQTRMGTVRIPDGNAILMPVMCRPLDRGKADRVWLLLARPYIWIKEEVEARKDRGKGLSQSIWDSPIAKEESEPVSKAAPIPYTDETKEILHALIHEVLTSPNLKDTRADYGTPKDGTFILVDGDKLGWPCELNPKVPGYHRLLEVRRDPFNDTHRVLGIRLDKFNLKEKATAFDGPIEVCLFNAGGNANGGVIGGCSVTYEPKRKGKHWTVEMIMIRDP